MRSTKELLEVLLDRYQNNTIEEINWAGLCWAITKLYAYDGVNFYEKEILLDVIEANRPESVESGKYWWPKGEVEPRIEFLKQLIKKYEQ